MLKPCENRAVERADPPTRTWSIQALHPYRPACAPLRAGVAGIPVSITPLPGAAAPPHTPAKACKGPDDQLECVLVGAHARLRAAGCGCLGSLLGAGSSTLSGGTPATGTDTLQGLLSPCTSWHRKGMRHGGIFSCWQRPRAPLTDLCGVSARGRLDSSRSTPWRHAGDAPRRGHGARGSGVYERHARGAAASADGRARVAPGV